MEQPTTEQIERQIDLCDEQIFAGKSKFRGMTYEDGVRAAIDWMRGDSKEAPMEQ